MRAINDILQDVSLWLGFLNLLVVFLGTGFVMLAFFEWRSLIGLRRDFEIFQNNLIASQHRMQKAMQRVIASYGIQDPDQCIALLRSAVAIDPTVFNGYNALGYAYLKKGDTMGAIDAFRQAIGHHPEDKEGYFDLARAYLAMQRSDLAEHYLRQAIQIDPSSQQDIARDPVLRGII